MSDTVSLRLNWKFRWFYTALFLGMATGSGWILSSWLPLLPTVAEPTYIGEPTWMDISFSVVMITIPIAAILVVGMLFYTCIYWWSFRLEFNDTYLETKGLPSPFNRHFRFSYDTIVRVAAGEMRGMLTIVPKAGRPLRIGANNLEGGSSLLLKELSKRISADLFQPDIQSSLQKYTRFEKRYSIIVVVYIAAMLPYFYSGLGHDFVKSKFAWNTVYTPDFTSHVQALDFGPDGSPSIISRSFITDKNRIVHITDSGVEILDFPTENELLQSVASNYGYRPDQLLVDDLGLPWVKLFPHGLLHWTGQRWEWYVFPNGRKDADIHKFSKADSKLWLFYSFLGDQPGGYWASIDPVRGVIEPIVLPEQAIQAGLGLDEFRATPDGALLVQASGKEFDGFYLLKNGQWQGLAIGRDWKVPLTEMEDFALDPSGNLWVLKRVLGDCKSRYEIGTYGSASGVWTWSNLTSHGACNSDVYYKSFAVDARQRVWFETNKSVDVFAVSAGAKASLLISYTPENSNYQAGDSGLTTGPDGRLWVADDSLVWIDAKPSTLPQPLPNWEITLASNEANWFLWWPLFMIVQIIVIIMNWRLRRQLTAKSFQQEETHQV